MRFPLWTNQKKLSDFKVIGMLPITSGMFVDTTRVYLLEDGSEKEIGTGLHCPIFHPLLSEPQQTKALDHTYVSDTVAEISQVFKAYMEVLRRGIRVRRRNQGKCTILLYGPYEKESIARGVADALKMSFYSYDVLQLIKEYPDQAVAEVKTFLLRSALAVGRPCLIFLDRFDEVVPRYGYTYITDVITAQLKFLLDADSITFIIASARWGTLVDPFIRARMHDVVFCGPKEEKDDWDRIGFNLLDLMRPSNIMQYSRWRTPNLILYGCRSIQFQEIVRSFAGFRSLKVVSIEAPQLLRQYNHAGDAAVSDLFLKATTERPAVLFIDQFDEVGSHPITRELCIQLDNLDHNVHVFVGVSCYQLINEQLRQTGRLDRQMLCCSAGNTTSTSEEIAVKEENESHQ